MPKKTTPRSARDRADKAMSDYVRQLWADPITEWVQCVSCDTSAHWKDMDCGHFIPKARGNAVRYDEHNVAPQCRSCNRFDAQFAQIRYYQWMLEHRGADTIRRLQDATQERVRFRVRDYLVIESQYKARTEELLEMRRMGEDTSRFLRGLPFALGGLGE